MTWTNNLIPNPSVEEGLDGYTGIGGAQLTWTPDDSMIGQFSIQVDVDGAGQGFIMDPILTPAPGTYAFSLYINATGPATIELGVATNPNGILRKSVQVPVVPGWHRYTAPAIVIPAGQDTVYLYVRTVSTVAITYWADALQLEPKTNPTDYCDGDQYGCYWDGVPNASSSHRDVQFPIVADGSSQASGNLTYYLPGPIRLGLKAGSRSSGSLVADIAHPYGIFDDFAVFRAADNDPAMTYHVAGNPGTMNGAYGQATTRHWGLFVPPVDYPVSSGVAWKKAAYAAVGFRYQGIPAGDWQYLDAVQLEPYPIDSTKAIGPTAYITPRQVRITVKPDRLNFAKNGGFETSTVNWFTASTGVTLTRDTTQSKFGTSSLNVALNNPTVTTNANTEVPQLITGRLYTVSAYVKLGAGMVDVRAGMQKSGNTVTVLQFGSGGQFVPYGGGPYGDGPYGGNLGGSIPVDQWVRLWFSFTALAETDYLRFFPRLVTGTTVANFWIDGVLIEESSKVGTFFTGADGYDYLWEAGGVPYEARSYYYRGRREKTYLISQLVRDNTPVGITMADPVYAVPYEQ